jgi:signal peptidase I
LVAFGTFIRLSVLAFRAGNPFMAPQINMGDIVFGFRSSHSHPNFGDTVVYVEPTEQATVLIGRIAGIPGDSIVIDAGRFYRNESEVAFFHGPPPPFTLQVAGAGVTVGHYYVTNGNWPPAAQWAAPDRIPDDCYLVLANAARADDSHLFGFVPGSSDGPCRSTKFPTAQILTRVISRWPDGGS